MWICPNCQNECETPFCPLCGYQMPTQYSEVGLLESQAQKMIKFHKAWRISAWILFGALSIFTVGWFVSVGKYMFEYHNIFEGAIAILCGYAVISPILLFNIFASKRTVKLWQNTISILKNNR